MNRRIVPFSLVLAGSLLAYACSSSDSSSPGPTGDDGGSSGTTSGGTSSGGTEGGTSSGGSEGGTDGGSGNPIQGTTLASIGGSFVGLYTEGPIWHTPALYFTTVGTEAAYVQLTPPGNTATVAIGAPPAGTEFEGSTFDTHGNSFVVTAPSTTGPTGLTGLYRLSIPPTDGGVSDMTPITLSFDAGVDGFVSPNDVVAKKDGTLYVTDPAFEAATAAGGTSNFNNYIWRVTTTGAAYGLSVENNPNGVALSADETKLYVSFTGTGEIDTYPIAADGSVGSTATKFATVPNGPTALVDALALDSSGNLYAVVTDGVIVFKPDGTQWGKLTLPAGKTADNVAFGGTDLKTIYVTSTTDTYSGTVTIPGIAQ